MALTPPKASDLFGDAKPAELAERFDEFQSELNKSFSVPANTPGQAPTASPMAQLEALAASKSLAPEAVAGLQNALDRKSTRLNSSHT